MEGRQDSLVLPVKLEILDLLGQMERGDHLAVREWMSVTPPSSSVTNSLRELHRETEGPSDGLDHQEISALQVRRDYPGLEVSLVSQEISERMERKESRDSRVHLEHRSISS